MEGPDIGNVPDAGSLRVLSRAELEAEVRRRTAELQDVMDTMADVLLTLDPDGRIEMANAAVEEVLGYDPAEIEGRPVSFLFTTPTPGGDTEGHGDGDSDGPADEGGSVTGVEFVERLVLEGTVRDLEVEFETAEGRAVTMQLSASVRREDGSVDGYVCVAKDISERKRRERKLQRQNEYLDEFASVVSHDIATPLGVIENKARLVEMTGDPDHAGDIYDAVDRIQRLVDDLLELARQGKRVGEVEFGDLETVARQAWGSLEAPDATLSVTSSTRVEASPERLRQLLENLLRNAVEHGSTEEGVTVRVGALPDGFYVADDGPGIPEADREQVFEQGFTTGEDGTGLGLAIVSRIADAHGWSVAVTESEAGGARFEVTDVTVRDGES